MDVIELLKENIDAFENKRKVSFFNSPHKIIYFWRCLCDNIHIHSINNRGQVCFFWQSTSYNIKETFF